MEKFDAKAGELPTWVEVVVEDATFQEELSERVRKLAELHSLDVLKVLRGSTPVFTCMNVGADTDDEAIEMLLEKPVNVFDHLLRRRISEHWRAKNHIRSFAKPRVSDQEPHS